MKNIHFGLSLQPLSRLCLTCLQVNMQFPCIETFGPLTVCIFSPLII